MKTPKINKNGNSKINVLAKNPESRQNEFLTKNQDLDINYEQNSLKVLSKKGVRGNDLVSDLFWTTLIPTSNSTKDVPIFGTDASLRREGQSEKPDSSLMTKRERQVIELIAEGLTNKEIGNTLYVSEFTVKTHVHNIMVKMALHTRLQIAKYFYASKQFKETFDSSNISSFRGKIANG